MTATVVMWDVGGTLVERVVSDAQLRRQALDEAGIHLNELRPDAEAYVEQHGSEMVLRWRTLEEERRGIYRLTETLLEGTKATQRQIGQVVDRFNDYYGNYDLIPGIQTLLKEVGDLGVEQAVLSNWPPSLRLFLDHHNLTPHFTQVIDSGEEGILKPDPQLFLRALEKLNKHVRDVVYIGNNVDKDIVPAQ